MRQSAEERRRAVIAAATPEFAHGGYAGTSTEDIARRAGISQPYLFRLFPTKRALFIAAVSACFDDLVLTFRRAADGLVGEEAFSAMATAYNAYLEADDLLLLQLQAYAAVGEPEIRAVVAERYMGIVEVVSELADERDPEVLRKFFAMGMLCNVVAALGLRRFDPLWEGMEAFFPVREPSEH